VTLTYDETREREHLRLLGPAIKKFIADCYRDSAATPTSPRQTLFFFPGGTGSQLTRATRKFVDGVSSPQEFEYEPVWLIPATLVGGARDLRMYRDNGGALRDKGGRIIVADAPVGFDGHTPHDALIVWCASQHVDLFVFPWDWRRRLDETARFFVRTFLPSFRAQVLAAGCPDPLERFSLVGHSAGGMVVNLILRGNDPIVATMTHAITVATPFFGYPGQLHRWFEGEPDVDSLGLFRQELMETIASLPGLYVLHLLDEETYRNVTSYAALTAQAPEFPLPSYPSVDATNADVRADAYNPQSNGRLVRYPAMTGFDRHELDYARLQFQQLTAPMDPHLLQKFYNIRGVVTEADEQTPTLGTADNVTWDWIPADFDSDDPTPIVDGEPVAGDDTQPAWSTCLATNDPSRCITVRGSDISHICMMNHGRVISAIEAILRPPEGAMRPRATALPEPASDDELVEFLRWVSENHGIVRQWPRFSDPKFRSVVPRKFSKNLYGLARRIFMDIMKRPAPRGLFEPQSPRPKAVRKPAARRGRRTSRKKKR